MLCRHLISWLQMYKVFVQNRPLYFILEKEISTFDGIFIRASLAASQRDWLFSLLDSTQENIPIYLFSDNLDESLEHFFHDYDFVEAAGGIVRRKNRILCIKRHGFWDLPKGKMEDGEKPEIAAVREIEEECGVKNATIQELLWITYHTYEFKGKPTIKKTYWFDMSFEGKKDVFPQEEEGITKVKWKKTDRLLSFKSNTYDSILDVIAAYESKYPI